MPYELDPTSSLEALADYVVGTGAGLAADERTRDLAADWETLEKRVAEERAAAEAVRRRALLARARLRIVDARWDVLVRDVSDRSLELSGRKAGEPPHSVLFDTLTAKEAREFGPHKVAALGELLVAKLRELKDAELPPMGEKLAALNAELTRAAADAKEAEDAEHAFGLRRRRVVDEIEAQAARTEVALLQRLPKKKRLVAAFLSPAERENGKPGRKPPAAER